MVLLGEVVRVVLDAPVLNVVPADESADDVVVGDVALGDVDVLELVDTSVDVVRVLLLSALDCAFW